MSVNRLHLLFRKGADGGQGVLNLPVGGEGAGREADGALGECTESLVGRRGAVEAAAGEDAVVLLQAEGGLGVVPVLKVQGEYRRPALRFPGTR